MFEVAVWVLCKAMLIVIIVSMNYPRQFALVPTRSMNSNRKTVMLSVCPNLAEPRKFLRIVLRSGYTHISDPWELIVRMASPGSWTWRAPGEDWPLTDQPCIYKLTNHGSLQNFCCHTNLEHVPNTTVCKIAITGTPPPPNPSMISTKVLIVI